MNLEQIDTSTTAGKAEVMRLAAEGRRVVYREHVVGRSQWRDHGTFKDPDWDWLHIDYAIIAALTPPEGYVVATRNEAGQAVAVTRQDDEGRILSVIAEFDYPQWNPIETAPKDGQYILACDKDATLVTHWMEGGWYEGEDRYEYFYWEPSHWMALPARPEFKNVND